MAPLESRYAGASVARADLLVRLCKRQALISFDQILLRELQILRAGILETDLRSVYSYTGDWFPENAVDILPVSWLEGIREFDVGARQQGHNRETRRKLKKQFFKNGRPTNVMSGMLEKRQFDLDEFLQKYPMRENDALVLAGYVAGRATCAQAQEAFLASLRDPSWMIRWYYNHSNKLSSFTDWVRGSSSSIVEMIEQVSEDALILKGDAEKLRETGSELGISPLFPAIDKLWWLKQQDQLVAHLAKQLASRLFEISLEDRTSSDVDRLAPGFSTCIRVLHSSIWESVGPSARNPKPSDWADTLHALYAPYVDIFRTDSYMARIIQEKTHKYGTTIVAKIEDLAEQIEVRLED
ncbi:hypothetical protein ICN42_02215 [Polynucleobacter sp. 71A-WALBACH]|nr:hypothetical protein [Polynucleobacter sp. 71A-WALBACH]